MFELILLIFFLVILFVIHKKFKHIIKTMVEIDQILELLDTDNNQTALDEVDTAEGGVMQCKKRGVLKDAINQGKSHLIGGKKKLWTTDRIDKAKDSIIDKLYNDYIQCEIQYKAENTSKAMSEHLLNLYSSGINKVLQIDDLGQLKKDINSDPVIKDSMADIGALMLVTFGKWLSPMLIACHTVNHIKWETPKKEEEERDPSSE